MGDENHPRNLKGKARKTYLEDIEGSEDDEREMGTQSASASAGKGRMQVEGSRRPVSLWDETRHDPYAASAYVSDGSISPELVLGSDEEYEYDPRDFEKPKDDHSNGAGSAAPSTMVTPGTQEVSVYWKGRKDDMGLLMAAQQQERADVLAQIKDLEDCVHAIDGRISDTKRARARLDLIIRRKTPDPKGRNYLSGLPEDIKYILKMFLTGLDLANLRAVDKTWMIDIKHDRDVTRIQNEKDRWIRPMDRIITPAEIDYRNAMIDFLWYLDTPVFISHRMEAVYNYQGRQVTTRLCKLGGYYNQSHKFYGGTDYLYSWDIYTRRISYARWGETESKRYHLPSEESCKVIVPYDGHLYFADYAIIRRFVPPTRLPTDDPSVPVVDTIENHTAITLPPIIKSQIVTFAMSEKYVLKANTSRVELWVRGHSEAYLKISVSNVKSLAMAGSTICIQKSNAITLYGDDGQPKRVYPSAKLRLANPLGHVDGSFLFDMLTEPNRLFRLARYAEYDKLIDENMQTIRSKQYSKGGKLGVFVDPYPASAAPYLYVSRPG